MALSSCLYQTLIIPPHLGFSLHWAFGTRKLDIILAGLLAGFCFYSVVHGCVDLRTLYGSGSGSGSGGFCVDLTVSDFV